jgi:DNA-binding CsgD family transcriptional regulator
MLTKREIEILYLIKKGLSQGKIAKKLKISQPAVSLFKNSAKKKLGDSIKMLKLIKKIGVKYDEEIGGLEF